MGVVMASYRAERIAELVHREVASLLPQLKDPRLSPISITRVTVPRDLSRAVVEWLPLGGGAPSDELVEALDGAARTMRGPVGRALGIRHSPELVFQVDHHTEQAIRVASLIEKVARERASSETAPEPEAEPDDEESP
jgi:ribosome-binding factor A